MAVLYWKNVEYKLRVKYNFAEKPTQFDRLGRGRGGIFFSETSLFIPNLSVLVFMW